MLQTLHEKLSYECLLHVQTAWILKSNLDVVTRRLRVVFESLGHVKKQLQKQLQLI